MPLLICTFPIMRDIMIREGSTIIHVHGAYYGLSGEGILHGGIMGLPTVFTDHSLFGFSEVECILVNKLQEFFATNLSHAICVSYTSKENTLLRLDLPSEQISVIPNAIIGQNFTPDPDKREPGKITIVIVSRLTYRKGTDLLAKVIPEICRRHSDVQFLIGGDGPKQILIEEAREKYNLQDRVRILGMLHHSQVRDVLVQGDIFLNTSITEAFCIAIVEAACCGLQVVSTNVCGVPEVLPPDLIHLVDVSVQSILKGLEEVISSIREKKALSHHEIHRRVKDIYSWSNVAERTEKIYAEISSRRKFTRLEIIQRFRNRSPVAGYLYVAAAVFIMMFHILLNWYRPSEFIDVVLNHDELKHNKDYEKY